MAIGLRAFTNAALLSTALSILLPVLTFGLEVPPAPTDIPIVDQTSTLSSEQKARLATIIADERKSTGNQIAVLVISSLENETLEDYSLDVARTWGVGTSERNSGVLLFIAKDDRRVRIEVGFGLEGALTDIRSGQIIRDRIAPQFQQERYYEGIESGLQGIVAAIHGETDPQLNTQSEQNAPSIPWEIIGLALFFIPTWLAAILARTKSWWAGGVIGAAAGILIGTFFGFMMIGIVSIAVLTVVGLLFDRSVSRNYQRHMRDGGSPAWWAGGTHLGGGGTGGFGGFGGGGFGGGGASGDW